MARWNASGASADLTSAGLSALSEAHPPSNPPVTLSRQAPEPHPLYDVSKRLLDISLSAAILLLAVPILAIAAAAILLTTRRSPLLVQRRAGLLGRGFSMIKLRTMATDDDEPPLDNPPLAPGEVFSAKAPDDPRVTPVGRLLRRTSIDELPQLLNVLAGQMSLVGPRPALPGEVARYPLSWRPRLAVKPGMTGLWQVSGRSEVAPRRRTAMDRYYVRQRSTGMDCLVLIRTIAATVSMRGAW